ncbi:DUF7010 family protein [Paracerasibacillus soli]|uniref:DUF308 domain-containing protein n=1 Tax=Paracerasibacillus soli TaxID=480284 RepID=A0ABU5CTS0_9BACI|nr:hypothetical protein [Virgibacillus soli]MDY0409753.1 hypothetical protein [Virgibacillus soli]
MTNTNEEKLNVIEAKEDLIGHTKKGVTMIYVGTAYWLLMGVLGFIDMHINLLGLFYLIGAGMIFPLSIFVASLCKIDIFAQDNPLSNMSGVLGAMQILFAPILILIFMEQIEWLPFFIAILTGAHFLPFHALYNSKAYIFLPVAVIAFSSLVGFALMEHVYTILPFGLCAIYLITTIILISENRKQTTSIKQSAS